MQKKPLLQTDKIISNKKSWDKFLKKIINENLLMKTIIHTKIPTMMKRKIYGFVMEVK